MHDVGFFLSMQAIRRQLAAMRCDRYLIRLIHHSTRKPLPGDRIWSAAQLLRESTIRFLRIRNCEGFDVYFRPHAADFNAGYILLDLDDAQPTVLRAMQDNGHEPCTVVETSPGHLQAWIQVSVSPLPPQVATPVSRHLARLYQADRASADWRHLGRLAGFTNQKPQRRSPSGLAPWVKLQHAASGLASHSRCLLEGILAGSSRELAISRILHHKQRVASSSWPPLGLTFDSIEAAATYQAWLIRLHIPQRFPETDWSIVDFHIARELLRQGASPDWVKSVLRLASPQFPRAHSDPEDYLRRTISRAAHDSARPPFPARTTAP